VTATPLVRNLKSSVKPTCPEVLDNDRCRATYVSGKMYLNCPVGNIRRSTSLKDVRSIDAPNKLLGYRTPKSLLGSAVASSGITILQYDLNGHLLFDLGTICSRSY